jgi:hypothetical protein
MPLNRSEIIAADAAGRVIKPVAVPQWGGDVCIRPLTVREEERFWEVIDDVKNGVECPSGKRGAVVMMACCNADGTALFTAADADWLGSGANKDAISLLFDEIRALSGVSVEAQADIEKKPD